jgi:hypothetical protein
LQRENVDTKPLLILEIDQRACTSFLIEVTLKSTAFNQQLQEFIDGYGLCVSIHDHLCGPLA